MRFTIVAAIITLIVALLLDLGIYFISRHGGTKPRTLRWFILSSAALYVLLIVAVSLPRRSGSPTLLLVDMWMLYTCFTVIVGKFIFLIFKSLSALPQLFKHKPWKWLAASGLVVAIAVFLTMWWGALINRNRLSVVEVDIPSTEWPESFGGYRIVQLSDLHTGTWASDTAMILRMVDRVNSLRPDLIVITGDFVNRDASELRPFIPVLSRLTAPDGVFGILGNHDYGDYHSWNSPGEKEQDRQLLQHLIHQAGIRLLMNETVMLKSGNDSIALIGVENIGDPPFHVYGSLAKAYPTPSDSVAKILLSHNPAHWTDDIADNRDNNIALTLSGHTHAMQIQIGHFTPGILRYPTPWGLYTDSLGRSLWVNRGIGTVGIPTRIGATPEITLITLSHK